jgi:PST family polysaccharide transporter
VDSGAPGIVDSGAADLRHLDRSLFRGVAWTGVAKLTGQTASWASTLVVARLLSPDDYGVYGLALLYLGLLQTVSDAGIGPAVIARQDLTARDLAQLNTVAVGTGIAGSLFTVAVAPFFSAFFRDPRLTAAVAVLGLTFVIGALGNVPSALLRRDMRFKPLAAYESLQAIVTAVASVAMAAAGFGYWTLVGAALLASGAGTAAVLVRNSVPFARPEIRRLRTVLGFGAEVSAQRLTWYWYANADFAVVGRMLGGRFVGAYSLAFTLANTAVDKIGLLILQVAPSVLSHVQHDPAALRRYVLLLTECLTVLVAPATLGLAIVAPEFVAAILGSKWEGMVRPLQILAGFSTIRMIMPLFNQLLLVTGRQRIGTVGNLMLLVVMPPAFVIGAWLGDITGVALAWLLVFPIVASWQVVHALRAIALPVREYVRVGLWPALSSCAVMAAVVIGVRMLLLGSGWSPLARLVVEILVGIPAYTAPLYLLHGQRVRAALAGLRNARSSGVAA